MAAVTRWSYRGGCRLLEEGEATSPGEAVVRPRSATPTGAFDDQPARSVPSGATAIRHVRVFDGTSVLNADSVLVRDGVLVETGSDLQVPHDAEIVDGAGGTLLPGLIDAHTHTFEAAELEQALAFGVSTELDMFCVPQLLGPLRRAADTR